MTDSVLWAGERAFLVELDSLAEVMGLHRDLSQKPLPGQREAAASPRTLLLDFRTRREAVSASRQVRRRRPKPAANPQARRIEIPVHYAGRDLDHTAELLGMSRQALIDWHTATAWVGAFGGFGPGFVYCAPEELTRRKRPRRSQLVAPIPALEIPRTQVPAGAVVLSGEFCAAYPRGGPGGWPVIGTTDAALWDSQRNDPALIHPGDHIRYIAQHEAIRVADQQQSTAAATPVAEPALEVLAAGARTLVQDLGRSGFRDLGVSRSGAADSAAARQANQLVGNDDAAPVFEVLTGGLELLARQTLVLAVTGADTAVEVTAPAQEQHSNMAINGTGAAPAETADGPVREVPARAPFWVFPGERLRLLEPVRGIRSYVAVSGGLAAPQVLGSAAADTRACLGPGPVAAGDQFGLIGATSRFVGIADVARTALPEPGEPSTLRFVKGPRENLFKSGKGRASGLSQLQNTTWQVSQHTDRVGIRFENEDDADHLTRRSQEDLFLEPMVRGAVQVPSSGGPLVLLADHPVTGSYPVIGVVVRADLGLAAQLPPGAQVRFVEVDPETLAPVQ